MLKAKLMEPIRVENWKDFQNKIQAISDEVDNKKKNKAFLVSDLLFRGQPNLELTTTLDRYVNKPIKLDEYYWMILIVKAQIETFTGHTWEIPSYEEFIDQSSKTDMHFLNDLFSKPALYSYLAYLRHHGFPSPLLDWTKSPYVALFFAFDFEGDRDDEVAIYAYLENAGSVKITSSSAPWIKTLGPNIKTHKRHFLQQSRYSFCMQIRDSIAYFASHEEVFSNGRDGQDVRWKILIPASQKFTFLKELDLMNINSYSLFSTEESLMKTLSLRYKLSRLAR